MNLKPQISASYKPYPTAFRDFKNPEFTVGNIVLDASKLTKGQVIKPFTAVFKNDTTGLFELVAGETPATMKAGCVTIEAVEVQDTTVNEMVPAVREASLIEERCTGITANFKEATKGRLHFDI